MESSVKLVKLVTGEEILCSVIESNDTYIINECVAVVLQPGAQDPMTGKSQMAFAFMPWGTMVKDNIRIDVDKVIYVEDPEEQVLEHYNKMFSKIQVPPKGLVIAR
jgi:hypothetical protein